MVSPVINKAKSCRVCKKEDLTKVFNFGPTPLANEFLKKEQIDKEEFFYPLEVNFCNNCSFLQLGHVVDPKILFGNYVYVSSTSKVFVNHFEEFAKSVFSRFNLNKESLVIDIGSNDGILLRPFKKLGVQVLGIDPAKHIASLATKNGIYTIPKFFNVELAKEIVRKKGRAKIITANNVFAHIDDLDEVINGLLELLDEDGVFIMEAPYLIDFIEKKYFDLVYHEHLSYWALNPLITLFKRFNMKIFDVQKVSAHGGTIRVFIERQKGPYKIENRVKNFLKLEKQIDLKNIKTYYEYAKKVEENRVKLLELLTKLKSANKRIVGYGAPAKGNTLLNYFGIGSEILDYIIDDSTWKQGLYSPGKRIPVVSSKKLYEEKIDYLLILAWNFADSIMKMHEEYRKYGGKFIIPVPKPIII